jgi:tetrahydromethanopterin S-methyltransferase subunit F
MSQRISGWAVGWTTFAGVMMIMMGIWWGFSGLVALFNNEFFVVTEEWIFQFDITAWGWIHLIVGIVILFAGFNLFRGEVWARTVGVIIAVLSALVAFAWLPYYPLWGILFIAVSIAIIWSLTAHGRDITAA